MKTLSLGLCTTALLWAACLVFTPEPAAGLSYDVFLLAGQSNMDGRGFTNELTGGFASWIQTQTNVLIYYDNRYLTGYTPSWQSLKPGWSEDNGALVPINFGPELSLGYALTNSNPGRNIALIKVTKGGTSLQVEWNPVGLGATLGVMYQNLTNAVPKALQALTASGHTYTVRGMLWHQGEADISQTQDAYQTALTNFIAAVRRDLSLTNLPFVIGEINRDNPSPGFQTIRQAQFTASQLITNAYFISSMNFPARPDGLHFYGQPVIGLGQRFGSQGSAFIANPVATQTWVGTTLWSTNTPAWTTNGGTATNAWTNNAAAVFNTTGGNVTVTNALSAYSLALNPGATGYAFNNGTLNLGHGGLTASESATIASAVNIGGLQSWSVAAGRTLRVSGPLNLSYHTLNLGGAGTTTLAGGVSDIGTNGGFLFNSSILLKTGTGTAIILNSNTFTGAAIIRGGNLQLGDGSATNGILTGNIDNSATLTFANPASQISAGILTGTGTVIKAGAGALSLTGSNAYTGGTVINAGTVSVALDNNLGAAGSLTINNGSTLQITGTNYVNLGRPVVLGAGGGVFDVNAASNNLVLCGPISGPGGLIKTGAGTLTIANTASFTGATLVSQGTLKLASAALNSAVSLATNSAFVVGPTPGLMGEYYSVTPTNVGNSCPDFASLSALSNHLAALTPNLLGLTATRTDFTFTDQAGSFPNPYTVNAYNFEVRWTGSFIATNSGQYTFTTQGADGNMLWVDGSLVVDYNDFGYHFLSPISGSINLTAGLHEIVIGYYHSGASNYGIYVDVTPPGGGTMRLPSAQTQFGATNSTIGPLSGDTGSVVNLGGYTLTVNQISNGTFAGNLTGAGNFVKAGSATLFLSAPCSFSGTATVNSGTLALTGAAHLTNASLIVVTNGAVLDASGRTDGKLTLANGQTLKCGGAVKGDLIVAGGATLSPGASVGKLTCANNLILTNTSVLQYELGTNSDLIAVTNNLTLAGTLSISNGGGFSNTTYTLFTYGGSLTYSNLTIGTTPNPGLIYTIDTNTPGVVKLVVTPGTPTGAIYNYVGYWKFDEGTGTFAADSSSFTNNGTLQGAAGWAAGKFGSALNCDGTSGYVQVASNLAQRLGGTATLCAWIKTSIYGSGDFFSAPGITGVEEAGGYNDIFWGWIDGYGKIGVQAGNTGGAQSVDPIRDGQWHHVGMTRGATTGEVKMYVDGVLNSTAISDTGLKTTPFYSLGRIEDTAGSPAYFNGLIDEVRIYSNILSAADIQELAALNPDAPSDPFSQWQLQYFNCTNCSQAAGSADPDGDGQDNNAEFLSATNPTNSASAFQIVATGREGSDLRITWSTGLNRTNALQLQTGNGFSTNSFADIFTVTNTVSTMTNYLDLGAAAGATSRFYRVRLVP